MVCLLVQDGILKNKQTYEIMDAESIGLAKNELGKTPPPPQPWPA